MVLPICYAPAVPRIAVVGTAFDSSRSRTKSLLGLLSYALLLGTGDVHAGTAIHATDWRRQDPVSVDALHGKESAHYEASRLESWSRCPSCVLNSQTSAHFGAAAGESVQPPHSDRPTADAGYPALASRPLGRSTRAPPD